ncbi:ATP-binding protein [Arsenicicoccus dermatophilus]|uniref:ATP-binding protein n=1 Tax=Arsenicicoccus dermatophilus TaxID=1076331 RepID=UPI001F4C564B|nr:ATP-binding protein [Arsenicicoccus dermatophilus]MCH8611512.1 ATP-binding protein [Arsenicicoccus dermatophilus]
MPPRVRTLDEVDESRLLPWALASAAEARTALRHTLAGKEVSDRTVDEAVQVLSELVANAVQHGAPLADDVLRVHWTLRKGVVEVDVTDAGGAHHPQPVRITPWQTRGRGLRIVRAYAHEWGVLDQPAGIVVWASLGGPSRRRTR